MFCLTVFSPLSLIMFLTNLHLPLSLLSEKFGIMRSMVESNDEDNKIVLAAADRPELWSGIRALHMHVPPS